MLYLFSFDKKTYNKKGCNYIFYYFLQSSTPLCYEVHTVICFYNFFLYELSKIAK